MENKEIKTLKIVNIEAEITTRVVLTEKAPFWVDIFYNTGKYYGTFLVRACVDKKEISKVDYGINVFDCYVIVKGAGKGLIALKTCCKRARK